MAQRRTMAGCLLALVCLTGEARAEGQASTVVVELGSAAGYSLKGGGPNGGPSVAVEVTAVETWLEIEAGVTPVFGHGGTEWESGLVFKKPFDLTDRLEVAAGAGPEWVHTTGAGRANALAAEAMVEFAYWLHPTHDIGVYVEPAYDYSFGRGHEQSLGVTGGLLIAIP